MGQVGSTVHTSRNPIAPVKKIWHSPAMMTWLALAVRLGGFALLMPLVLANFTAAEVSVWLLFSAIASFQVVADFGFGPTFSREIAYGFAGHTMVEKDRPVAGLATAATPTGPDWDAIASATAAMLWLYRRIALATFILLAVFGTWATMVPIERVAQSHAAWVAWGIVTVTTATAIYGNAYSSFLIGANRIDLLKRLEIVVGGISLLVQLITLILDMGLLGFVLVAQIGLVVQVFVNRTLAFRLSGGRFGNAGQIANNKLVLRSMWPAAWRTALGAVMSIGIAQGMAIAMANLLVAAEAASVQLGLRVMQIISQCSQVPFYTRIPELNRLGAVGHASQLAAAAASAMRSSLLIFVSMAVIVDLGVRQLFMLLGSHTPFPDKLFWLVLVLAVFSERFGAMHIQLLLTKNKAISHIANAVTGVIWLAGMIILYPMIGSLALPSSMLIAYAGFYAWYSASTSHKVLALPRAWKFERATSLPSLVFILLYTACMAIVYP